MTTIEKLKRQLESILENKESITEPEDIEEGLTDLETDRLTNWIEEYGTDHRIADAGC